MVVSLQGEVDLATAPELEAALEHARRGSARLVIVDLRAVNFLDSTGLSLLVRQEELAREASRRLIIVKGPPQVQQVFDVTGVSGHLTMVAEPPA